MKKINSFWFSIKQFWDMRRSLLFSAIKTSFEVSGWNCRRVFFDGKKHFPMFSFGPWARDFRLLSENFRRYCLKCLLHIERNLLRLKISLIKKNSVLNFQQWKSFGRLKYTFGFYCENCSPRIHSKTAEKVIRECQWAPIFRALRGNFSDIWQENRVLRKKFHESWEKFFFTEKTVEKTELFLWKENQIQWNYHTWAKNSDFYRSPFSAVLSED